MTLCPCQSPVCEQRRAMVALLREARKALRCPGCPEGDGTCYGDERCDFYALAQRIDALLREVEE
jgi:hypothetical protein